MLSPRLDAICRLLGKNKTVADIGCDHGKLSVFLSKTGAAETVYATDISPQSLEKAKRLAFNEGIDNIRFYCGDGFGILPHKPDAAVVAGMGGEVISGIIAHPFAKTKLILQPMKDTDLLYKGLHANGFRVTNEIIVREAGRFYEVISAEPGDDVAFDYSIPPIDRIILNDDAQAFIEHKIFVIKKALLGAECSCEEAALKRCDVLRKQINTLEGFLADGYGK